MSHTMQSALARAVLCLVLVLTGVHAFAGGFGPAQGSGGGSALSGLGSTDNAVLRTDGTGGSTAQGSSVVVNDTGTVVVPASAAVVVGGATTSGVRLEVNSGILDVREGDDSAAAAIRASLFNTPNNVLGFADVGTDHGSGGKVRWSSTTAYSGAKDTDIHRSSAGVVGVGNGTSALYTLPGVLTKSVTSAQTGANTDETTLWSYPLPAGTLASDGQAVRIKAWGTTAANGNTKSVALKFGATSLRTASTSTSGAAWVLDAVVARTGAAAQTASATSTFNVTGTAVTTPGETLSGAVTIAVTGTNGTASAGDITFSGAIVELLP